MGELSVADVLNRAADLIEPEGAWTQGEYGLDKCGRGVVDMKNAVCFCTMGAIHAVSGGLYANQLADRARKQLRKIVGIPVVQFNDDPSRTQAEVVAALREAATLAQGHAA